MAQHRNVDVSGRTPGSDRTGGTDGGPFASAGFDAIALKPAECDVARAADAAGDAIVIDYEGHEHVPDVDTLRSLAADRDVRLTIPVRADGFDPLGDDGVDESLPDEVARVLVAGHPAYLSAEERERATAPRLDAAVDARPDAWVGTERIERIAMATGATQYDLLSPRTERELAGLRAAGYDGRVAVYAPTVFAADPDVVLDAIGAYVARRRPVARALPDGAATDASAAGRAREILRDAVADYALVGTTDGVANRVDALRAAGATAVVGYPARGVSALLP